MAANEQHFCTELGPAPVVPGLRAAIKKDLRWERGDTITACFLGGSPALGARVAAVAQEWVAPGPADLDLLFVDAEPADIRITFEPGTGSWSSIGTACRDVRAGRPTMNFGWLTDDSADTVLRPVVLHEFGHVVGLVHEHQNPLRPIAWNRAAVLADLTGPPNNWDAATVERNIFATYERGAVEGTELDPLSIMMYPIPAAWTLDGFSSGFTTALSELDRALVRKVYGG